MKWRIVKNKFNREKQKAIGHLVCATFKDGSQVWSKIKDIKISPAGGNKAKYDLKNGTLRPARTTQADGKDQRRHQHEFRSESRQKDKAEYP